LLLINDYLKTDTEKKTIMKKLKISLHPVLFSIALIFLIMPVAVAQGPGGPGDPGDPNPDAAVPLDGGVALLLVMAACYVLFKVWQHRKMSKLAPPDMS
jgi:UDP-N-acetylmuramyl pentapeptide phosphotransferase/UDP-N-acetylglucosamine-1-phosphate transferase